MGSRPILLLDVDGVLNVFDADLCPNPHDDFDVFPEDHEPVRLCMIHGDWLRELEALFEVTWATGWGEEAPRLLAPLLGLGDYPFVPMPAIPFDPAEKVPAIDAVVGSRAVAWLDDIVTPEARGWAQGRTSPTPVDRSRSSPRSRAAPRRSTPRLECRPRQGVEHRIATRLGSPTSTHRPTTTRRDPTPNACRGLHTPVTVEWVCRRRSDHVGQLDSTRSAGV